MNNGYIDVMGIEENGEQNGNDDAINNAMPTIDMKVTIDRIRDERTNEETGEHEYLVKFKPVKEMWINSVNIEMFPELIQDYQKRKHNAPVYIDEEQQEEEDGSIDNESVDNRRHSSRQRAPTKRYVDKKENPNKKKSTPHRKASQSAKSAANQEDDDEDSDAEYTAEKILDKKVTKTGAEKYLVKWRGYGPEWNTWEPRKGIKHLKVFKKYEKKLQDGNDDEGEDEYTVEHIMERKVYKDGAIMYFIKWQGYDDTWNSWEPRDSLLHLDIVKKYEAENPMEEKEKVAKSKEKKGKKPGRKRSIGKQNYASTPTTSKKPRIEESTEKEKKKVMKKRKGTRRY